MKFIYIVVLAISASYLMASDSSRFSHFQTLPCPNDAILIDLQCHERQMRSELEAVADDLEAEYLKALHEPQRYNPRPVVQFLARYKDDKTKHKAASILLHRLLTNEAHEPTALTSSTYTSDLIKPMLHERLHNAINERALFASKCATYVACSLAFALPTQSETQRIAAGACVTGACLLGAHKFASAEPSESRPGVSRTKPRRSGLFGLLENLE